MVTFHKRIKNSSQLIFGSKYAVFGLSIVLLVVIIALFATIIAPYDYTKMDKNRLLENPSSEHLMGTDQFGRDVFSRV